MPLPMQAKLLRVLQEKEVDRLGGTGSRWLDLRLIAATGRNLEEMVGQGTFRADLYYRVNVIPIRIPPLREHPEDLDAIAEAFLARLSADIGEPKRRLSAGLLEILRAYPWPGNVRELQNGLERAMAMSTREDLRPENFPAHLIRFAHDARTERTPGAGEACGQEASAKPPGSLASIKAEAERSAILSALAAVGGNRTRAAELLRIHRVKLHEKIKRYGIDGPPPRRSI
jgi:transcriptional regulator with PAS, ATPase and Fis domain